MLAFFVYMLSTLIGLWSTFSESKAELENLKLQCESEKESIEELKVLLDDKSNKQIIEKAARERLGYIYSDEQIFIDISGS
jgi:cell division protein FtsB